MALHIKQEKAKYLSRSQHPKNVHSLILYLLIITVVTKADAFLTYGYMIRYITVHAYIPTSDIIGYIKQTVMES